VSQGALAKSLYITPGMISSYIKQLSDDGEIVIKKKSAKNITYLLTNKGMRHKNALFDQFIKEKESFLDELRRFEPQCKPQTIRIAIVDNLTNRTIKFGQAIGFIPEDVQIDVYLSGKDIVKGIKQYDMALVGSVPAYTGLILGERYNILARIGYNAHSLITKNDYRNVEQMNGDNVYVIAAESFTTQLLSTILDKETQMVVSDEIIPRLLNGQDLDGMSNICLWEPFTSYLLSKHPEYRIIFDWDKDSNKEFISNILVDIDKNNKAMSKERLIDGLIKTIEYINRNQEEAVKYFAQVYNLPVDVIGKAFKRTLFYYDKL